MPVAAAWAVAPVTSPSAARPRGGRRCPRARGSGLARLLLRALVSLHAMAALASAPPHRSERLATAHAAPAGAEPARSGSARPEPARSGSARLGPAPHAPTVVGPTVVGPTSAGRRVAAASARAAASRRLAASLERRGIAAAASLRRAENDEAGLSAAIDALEADDRADDARIHDLAATLASLVPLLRAAPAGEDASRASLALRGVADGIARLDARLADARRDRARREAVLETERDRLMRLHAATARRAAAIERVLGTARRAAEDADRARDAAAGDAAAAAARRPSLRDAIASLQDAHAPSAATQGIPARAPPGRATLERALPGGTPRGATGRPAPVAAAATVTPSPGHGAGHLTLPVAGPIVRRFGAPSDAGPATGDTFAPPPAALVAAPCTGRVDFAGPFRSYGHMVIIDCGHDERVVLAGLDRLDAAPGTAVRAGSPVGRMPDGPASGATGRPTLMLQLRRGTETVDPIAPGH